MVTANLYGQFEKNEQFTQFLVIYSYRNFNNFLSWTGTFNNTIV